MIVDELSLTVAVMGVLTSWAVWHITVTMVKCDHHPTLEGLARHSRHLTWGMIYSGTVALMIVGVLLAQVFI